MRSVTKETITKAFLSYCGDDTNPRLRLVLERLIHHLHAFAKDVDLTHEEWRKGIELMTKAGEISDAERNEFVLLSDVLGLSSLVDMINTPDGGTSSSVLGPFHILGAPEVPVGGDLKGGNDGPSVVVFGRICDTRGQPVKNAVMDIWQTAPNGLYSNQDKTQPVFNLRGRMAVGDDGCYAFTTVRPAPYTVPDDGPVGELLRGTGRHPWRPSHLHFIIQADGHKTLVTEIFPAGDPYLDEDAVFGVREDLIVQYRQHGDLADIPDGLMVKRHLTIPYFTVEFDFRLAKN